MKTVVNIIILLFILGAWHTAHSQETERQGQQKDRIHWLSFEQLSDSLDVRPKPVLISFHTDWCVYCRKMHREVFTAPEIVQLVNANYYAVQFDAESRDTVLFDGQLFVNKEFSRRRDGFHEIARLLGEREGRITVPVTIILEENFTIRSRHFEYLSIKNLKTILE